MEGLYSVSDIQDNFECIIKKHDPVTDNKNRITFKIKRRYYLQLLTPGTMKLLGSTKSKVTKDENDENVPHLAIIKVILIHCNTCDMGTYDNIQKIATGKRDGYTTCYLLDYNYINKHYKMIAID